MATARKKGFDPRFHLPALPPMEIQNLLETAVSRQATERERDALQRSLEKDEGVLTIAQRDYHHGTLGKVMKAGVYQIPTMFAKRIAADYPKDPPLKPCTKEQAAKQLASNKEAYKKREKEITDWLRGVRGRTEDDAPAGGDESIGDAPLVS